MLKFYSNTPREFKRKKLVRLCVSQVLVFYDFADGSKLVFDRSEIKTYRYIRDTHPNYMFIKLSQSLLSDCYTIDFFKAGVYIITPFEI